MAIGGAACTLLLVAGCEQSAEEKAKWAEEKRIDCRDKICEGDKPPRLDRPLEDVVMKIDGEYFIAPRALRPSSYRRVFTYRSAQKIGATSFDKHRVFRCLGGAFIGTFNRQAVAGEEREGADGLGHGADPVRRLSAFLPSEAAAEAALAAGAWPKAEP